MKQLIIIVLSCLSLSLFSQINFGSIDSLYNTSNGINSLDTADFNGDGYVDILSSQKNSIFWIENYQKGNFSSTKIIKQTPSHYSNIVKTADIDGDNDIDFVSIIDYSRISWFENDGNGNFSNEKEIVDTIYLMAGSVIQATFYDIRLVDIDNNGTIDLLSLSNDSLVKNLKIFINDGLGNFTFKDSIRLSGSGNYSIETFDFNSDNFIDISIANELEGWLALYKNNGGYNFNSYLKINNIIKPRDLKCADINSDGIKDILLSSGNSGYYNLRWFNISDTANIHEYLVLTKFDKIKLLSAIDLDNNGTEDLISANYIGQSDSMEIIICLSLGNGNFNYINLDTSTFVSYIIPSDLDLDGDLDLVLGATNYYGFAKSKIEYSVKSKDYPELAWIENLQITNIKNIERDNIQLFPNPVSDIIFIENINSGFEYSIYDITGKLIDKNISNNNRIDNLSRLGSGVYILKIKNKNNLIKTNKFIKL